MEFRETAIAGLLTVHVDPREDDRGGFTKLFHAGEFEAAGLRTDFCEQYCSTSMPGVLRGMHFQLPPHDHAKLVYALSGRALDVVVDLRPGSPTFGEHCSFELEPGAFGVYMPIGMAHGFTTLGDEAVTLLYDVTSVHAPDHDAGIRWDSVDVEWPTPDPTLSPRDAALPPLEQFAPPSEWAVQQ